MSTTVAGTDPPRGSPRRRLVVGALVVSLVLNVFFVVGAVWTQLHPSSAWPDQGKRFREIENGLNLEPSQRPGFERYVTMMRSNGANLHQQVGSLIAAAWEEMAKPSPDEAQIMRLFDQAAEKRREFQRNMTKETLSFLAVLTPAQRAKFITIARQHRPPWARYSAPH